MSGRGVNMSDRSGGAHGDTELVADSDVNIQASSNEDEVVVPDTEQSSVSQNTQSNRVVDVSLLQKPRNAKAAWWGNPIFQYKDHVVRIARGDPDTHCTTCNKDLKYNGSTGNLTGHMSLKHKGWDQPTGGIVKHLVQKPTFAKAVVKWMVDTYQPLSVTEAASFKELVASINSAVNIPSRRDICLMLDELELTARSGIRKAIDGQFIAITTDAWTSAATESYLSLTAHYLDGNFNMHSVPLECAPFPGSHTAERIKEKLEQLLERNGIPLDFVSAVVADNAANQSKAGDLCAFDSVPCAPHTLQLTVKDILEDPDWASLLKKARKVVGAFKHSALKGQVGCSNLGGLGCL